MRKARRKIVMGLMMGLLGLGMPAVGWAASLSLPFGADSGVELRHQQKEQVRPRLAQELEGGPAAGGGDIGGLRQRPRRRRCRRYALLCAP